MSGWKNRPKHMQCVKLIPAHTQILTHFTSASVSVTANQTPFQTPASCLATPPHFHGDAIKSNNTQAGEKWMMVLKMK